MYDRELLVEDFKNISWALDQIAKRFSVIALQPQVKAMNRTSTLIKRCLSHPSILL